MIREKWQSQLGFIWAATGSAVGLGSIWRFPYVVGENGGAAFIIVFVFFLIFLSLPILLGELCVGRFTQRNPSEAFLLLGRSKFWKISGSLVVCTGFLVSSFYGVVCSWSLAYFIKSVQGELAQFTSVKESSLFFKQLSTSFEQTLFYYVGFILLSGGILFFGVQKGIEKASKIMMPLLFLILLFITVRSLFLQEAKQAFDFLFLPKWSELSYKVILLAMGQAFFALSLGQGTMVTYGSYLNNKISLVMTCFAVSTSVIIVSLMAGIAIFSTTYSVGLSPSSGPSLLFESLPMAFSLTKGGWFVAVGFFFLVFLAGLSSQISALEPSIAFLMDKFNVSRSCAVICTNVGSFALGLPCALSFCYPQEFSIAGISVFEYISAVSVNLLVPLGGIAIVILVGWKSDIMKLLMIEGTKHKTSVIYLISTYKFINRFVAPVLILIILINFLVEFLF